MSFQRYKSRIVRLLSHAYPIGLEKTSSRHNGDIRVRLHFGLPELWINGALQSGPGYEKLWELAFDDLEPLIGLGKKNKVLVLGIGGANTIHLIRSRNSRAHITAVDIDPAVIALSRRYFGLSRVPGLDVVCGDADVFLTKAGKNGSKFDLVFVDVYKGYDIPSFLESEDFAARIFRILQNRGAVVLNYTPEGDLDRKVGLMLDKFRKVFHSIYSTGVYSNRFICAVR